MGAELGHSCLPVGVAAAEEGPSTPTLPCRTEESPPSYHPWVLAEASGEPALCLRLAGMRKAGFPSQSSIGRG